jgi:hypothetical protein
MEITSDLWPCLGETGLQLFATTADQRYQVGTELFLATHFPVTLRRLPPQDPAETLAETVCLGANADHVRCITQQSSLCAAQCSRLRQVRVDEVAPAHDRITIRRVPR